MFGLTKATLPVTLEQKRWVDNSLLRLAGILGANRMLEAKVILPTPEYFPDPFDESEAALQSMFERVCGYMQMDPSEIELTTFVEGRHMTSALTELAPIYGGSTTDGAAGLYHHEVAEKAHVSISETKLKDPVALVATLAHELSHVMLLRPGLVDRDEKDMEPLTDLLTVFLGLGIFGANAAFHFEQHSDYSTQGWSAGRSGYLLEQEFGYALGRFAYERGEEKPVWRMFLSTNVGSYMKKSMKWLKREGERKLLDAGR